MPLHLSRTLSWAANSAVFLLAPFVLMTALFLAAFLPLPSDQFFYDASAAVFPIGCPHQIEYSHCVAVTAWYQYWSVSIWGATALLYGRLVTRRSVRYKLVLGALLMPAVIGLLQVVMLLLGWQWFIDTL